jgi:hypothetical protein
MEFRAEAFNVLNHPQLYGSNSVGANIKSLTSGQIVAGNPHHGVTQETALLNQRMAESSPGSSTRATGLHQGSHESH